MNKEPIFIDANGLTIRINPRTSAASWICLQIMEPPQFNDQDHQTREGKFTQIYVTKDQAKFIADALFTEAMLGLIE